MEIQKENREMSAMTPQQQADKWAANTQAAGPSVKAGVLAVQVAPGQAAAAKADVWAANVAAAKQKWQQAVGNVTLASWQQSMLGKGLQNMAAGVNGSKAKVAAHLAAFVPYIKSAAAAAAAQNPGSDVESGIQRAAAVIRAAKAFKKTASGIA
jgi:hypothetical protein